jgi:hypothetical protein
LINKLYRFIKAKSPFKVVLVRNSRYFFNKTGLVKNFKLTTTSTSLLVKRGIVTNNQKKFKLTLKKRIREIIYDIFNLLTKIKKMKLLMHFYKIFPLKSRHFTYVIPFFFLKSLTVYSTLFLIFFNKRNFFFIDSYPLMRLTALISVL